MATFKMTSETKALTPLGAAAALASKKRCSPLDVPFGELCKQLTSSGAVVPQR